MGIFSFIKDAGSKLFGANEAEAAADKAAQITAELARYNVEGVTVTVNDDAVVLTGQVAELKDIKKAIIIAGNIDGIASVSNEVTIAPQPIVIEAEKAFYTVKSGDTLSKISGEVYGGDVMKYEIIFEANRPMLEHPDKIYPGQVLIIPELEA